MKTRALFAVLIASCALMTLSGRALAGDEHKGHEEHEGHDAMMQAWAKMAAPGKFHAHLNAIVGKWSLVTKWRMSPDAPWMESKSTSEQKWILGGRFVRSEVTGELMQGERFEGLGLWGYDNAKKKYTSVWIDSMGTMIMTSLGTCDDSGKVFTMSGVYDDPMTGQEKKQKSITRIISADKHVFELYDTTPGGKEFKTLDITYTRIK